MHAQTANTEPWNKHDAFQAIRIDHVSRTYHVTANWEAKEWIPPWHPGPKVHRALGWLPPRWHKDKCRTRYAGTIPKRLINIMVPAVFMWGAGCCFRHLKCIDRTTYKVCCDHLHHEFAVMAQMA